MTNLSDFLKVEKVRCVSKNAEDNLTIGKEYKVTHIIFGFQSDNNSKGFYDFDSFEPVLDQAENPLENMKLTPEFDTEASEPKFKVGDPVYCPLQTKELCKVFSNDQEFQPQCPLTITEVRSRHSGVSGVVVACVDDYGYSDEYDNAPFIFHATPENHALLSKLYPHIEFERPPLTGSDLARAMLDKGWHLVPCVVSDVSDSDALNHDNCCLVDEWCVNYFDSDGYRYKYAVPFDPRTGEPLTESVLND